MEGFDNHGKDVPFDMGYTPVEDLVSRSKDPLGEEDVFDLSLILTQPQGQRRRACIRDTEKVEEGRDIHLPAGISENTFTEVEDDIRREFLQPVYDGMDFLMDGKNQAFMTDGMNGILYGPDLLFDRLFCQDILVFPLLKPLRKIVQYRYPHTIFPQ
jgi:hypothetical protein